MKKLFVALMAVMAIVLSGCKRENSVLTAENHYSKTVAFLFSHDEKCRSIESADFFSFVEPGKAGVWTGVKTKGLHAILFVCTKEKVEGDKTLQNFEYVDHTDLSSYEGWLSVTVSADEKGMIGVGGNTL